MTAIVAKNTPVELENSENIEDFEDIENIEAIPGEPRPFKDIIADVQATNEPRLLTIEGKPQMVCLSVAAYRAMEAKIDYWETVASLYKAEKQCERGETRSAREALTELGRQHGILP